MVYKTQPVPRDAGQLSRYVEEQLRKVSDNLGLVDNITLKELHVEPEKPRDGSITLADGSNWNPGAGAGFYGYQGAGWVPLSGNVSSTFETRAVVETLNIPTGVDFIRTSGYTTASDGGGALYERVGSEPSHELKVQSADGAWWELVAEHGWINVLQAGAAFHPTDSVQAFRDCADFARHNTGDEQSGGANGPAIIVPQGKFKWDSTFEPRAAITMIGFKRGVDGNMGTIIEVAADTTGMILPKNNTLGAGKEDPDDPLTKGANGSFIQGFRFESLGGTDEDKHGIHVRCPSIMLSHIECRLFPGDGFHTVASSGAVADDLYGNANHWRYEHCYAFRNQRNGFYFSGSDANVGVSTGLNANSNGRWGVWDRALLSNTHVGAHASGNGHGGSGVNEDDDVTCFVSEGGNRYVVMPGQETAASTTTPGTDASVWFFTASGGVGLPAFPAWSNGNTYVAGGSYFFESGAKEAFGCYSEGDNLAVVDGLSRMIGGSNNKVISLRTGGASGSFWAGHQIHSGGLEVLAAPVPSSGPIHVKVMPAGNADIFFAMHFDSGPNKGVNFTWDTSNKFIRGFGDGSAGSWPMAITTALSTITAGRDATEGPKQGDIVFPNGFFIGVTSNARFMGNGTAAPSSDLHAKGEIVWNRSQSAGGVIGWICVTSGTPGTWVEIRGLADQQSHVADPTGGGTVDAEGRTAINAILDILEAYGFAATS